MLLKTWWSHASHAQLHNMVCACRVPTLVLGKDICSQGLWTFQVSAFQRYYLDSVKPASYLQLSGSTLFFGKAIPGVCWERLSCGDLYEDGCMRWGEDRVFSSYHLFKGKSGPVRRGVPRGTGVSQTSANDGGPGTWPKAASSWVCSSLRWSLAWKDGLGIYWEFWLKKYMRKLMW